MSNNSNEKNSNEKKPHIILTTRQDFGKKMHIGMAKEVVIIVTNKKIQFSR